MTREWFFEVGPPVNDGEREVLRRLRDHLPDGWCVVANFEYPQGVRWYECDALVLSPGGWGYLVETKAWTGGSIRGNDHEWILPPLLQSASAKAVPPPVHLVGTKSKKLASYLKTLDPSANDFTIVPLVVVVSPHPLRLAGKSAEQTVLVDEMIQRLLTDPRNKDHARSVKVAAEANLRIGELLSQNSRPLSDPENLGPYRLVERLAIADDHSEIWRATLLAGGPLEFRVKRYRIDPLLTGQERQLQEAVAQRDLQALTQLRSGGVVPLVGNVIEHEDSLIVATAWPEGESLASVAGHDDLEPEEAVLIAKELIRSVADIHRAGIVHRNLRPESIYVADSGKVVIADFDYARIPAGASVTSVLDRAVFDHDLMAPEVRAEPSRASMASDTWSLASIVVHLLESVGRTLEDCTEAFSAPGVEALRRALLADPQQRPVDATAIVAALDRPHPADVEVLQVNDSIEGRYVVNKRIATGGVTIVYKVFDPITRHHYAAKFVRADLRDKVNVTAEWDLLNRIPEHPGVMKAVFPQQMTYVARGKARLHSPATFLLSDWVEGLPLADLLAQPVPPARVARIGAEAAKALTHVHAHNLWHRDVKPENIVVTEDGKTAVLLDFNISAVASDERATLIGTPPYRAPEVATSGWSASADVYSLSVTMVELLAGCRLGTEAQSWLRSWRPEASVERLRVLLLSGTSEEPTQRPSAEELAEQLEALAAAGVGGGTSVVAPPPTYERRHSNHNPYMDRLIGLFSQSSVSNAGTRGLDEFREWAYVRTRLDSDLGDAIVAGELGLVVISGNAGDGKTAFIRMIENRLTAMGAQLEKRDSSNGSVLTLGKLQYRTNWDGSQDEGKKDNDRVLLEFLHPYRGQTPPERSDLVSVIAINEGRLVDFLAAHRDEFLWLDRRVSQLFSGGQGHDSSGDGLAVVNLNLRSLTIWDQGRSMVGEVLDRFADERLWEACGTCDFQDLCYATSNAAVLRDPVLGPRAQERIRQTLDVVRLRRRLHITMRDLSSALAYTVAGNRTCEEIGALAEENDVPNLLAGHLYNALFAARAADGVDTVGGGRDRLLAEVGDLDVADNPDPQVDGRLWSLGPSAIPHTASGPQSDRLLLHDVWSKAKESALDATGWAGLLLGHSSLRRKWYLEREDPGYIQMLPFDHLTSFVRMLQQPTMADTVSIAEAISASEGLRAHDLSSNVAVRLVEDPGAENRTFVMRAASEFLTEVVDRGSAARFVEYAPDLLRFRDVDNADLALDLDLDVYEALMRMQGGYTPSREDLRGSWLSLQAFKERLASIPSDKLLLQPQAGPLRLITKDEDGRVVVGAQT